MVFVRRLAFAAAAFVATLAASPSHAQSGPFTGLAGNWSGGGTVTLDDGSSERLRCRATYAVGAGGNGLNQSLTCASDAYRFVLSSNIVSEGGAVSGSWNESTRNVSGTIQGHATPGNIQVTASAVGFTANIALKTTGNRQSVMIKADTVFRGANISLSR